MTFFGFSVAVNDHHCSSRVVWSLRAVVRLPLNLYLYIYFWSPSFLKKKILGQPATTLTIYLFFSSFFLFLIFMVVNIAPKLFGLQPIPRPPLIDTYIHIYCSFFFFKIFSFFSSFFSFCDLYRRSVRVVWSSVAIAPTLLIHTCILIFSFLRSLVAINRPPLYVYLLLVYRPPLTFLTIYLFFNSFPFYDLQLQTFSRVVWSLADFT